MARMSKIEREKETVRARRSFTDEYKASAVGLVLDEGKTVAQVAREREKPCGIGPQYGTIRCAAGCPDFRPSSSRGRDDDCATKIRRYWITGTKLTVKEVGTMLDGKTIAAEAAKAADSGVPVCLRYGLTQGFSASRFRLYDGLVLLVLPDETALARKAVRRSATWKT